MTHRVDLSLIWDLNSAEINLDRNATLQWTHPDTPSLIFRQLEVAPGPKATKCLEPLPIPRRSMTLLPRPVNKLKTKKQH